MKPWLLSVSSGSVEDMRALGKPEVVILIGSMPLKQLMFCRQYYERQHLFRVVWVGSEMKLGD